MSAVSSEEPVPRPVFERMVALRRDLHRHPELSLQEERTATRILEELAELGLEGRRVAGTGVVADVPGRAEGPRIALRGDIDALPIEEETGLPFASERPGVMHACGHDGHTSMVLGAAALLLDEPPPLGVRLVFQPAEEVVKGAAAMVREGVLDGVAAIFGGHLDRHFPAGTVVITDGPVNASTDLFTIDIHGRGGHGARPHEALDAVVVGSLLVTSLQTIVSREVNPAHPSVITVGSFEAGTAPNVIAASARLQGTIRAQGEEVRTHLARSIARIAQAIGQLHEAAVDVEVTRGTPAVINSPAMAALAREAARAMAPPPRVEPLPTANMGGEDFSFFLERVPGCYVRFGAQVPGRESYPAHSSLWDFDERALGTGAAWLAAVARTAGARVAAGETLDPDWRAA
jgi:hippurate hydrolase